MEIFFKKFMNDEISIVIQLVGYHCVGKSTTLFSYSHNYFKKIINLGQTFDKKIININNCKISLIIYDLFFNELYIPTNYTFHSAPQGLLLIFDITNRKTFEHAAKFIDSLKYLHYKNPFYLVLAGNKLDLENEREVTKDEAQNFANKHKIKYFEMSAKVLKGLDEVFNDLANNIYNEIICKKDNSKIQGQIFVITDKQKKLKRFLFVTFILILILISFITVNTNISKHAS